MPHAHHVTSQSYGILLILILTAGLYLRGWLLRSFYQNRIPAWRAGSFLLGIFLIWVAVASPIAGTAHELLTGHMVQHILLMTFAAPLIWVGEPMIAFVHGMPKRVKDTMALLLRWRPAQVLGNAITHPAACWLGAAGALFGWHIPALFALGMESPVWHAIMEMSFLVAGLLFWYPVFQPWPSLKKPGWLIVFYLFLATLPCDILSGFLVFCDRVVYPGYVDSLQPFGLSPLQDQQLAGALMWTVVTVIYFIFGGVISARLLSPNGLQQSWIRQQPAFDSAAPLAARQRIEVV